MVVNGQVGANMKNGMVEKDNFKIVYVAPMKALAAEMTATFSKRLASLGNSPPAELGRKIDKRG
jgi:activating signal cointegrator complex subunit 3